MSFFSCGDCTACCDGHLTGDAFSVPFGPGSPCTFLINKSCTVYSFRPDVCKNYQCAWSQGLFPEWMKPNRCNILISVEQKDDIQFLKLVPITYPINQQVIDFLDEWVVQYNTYYVIAEVNYENKPRIWLKKD
ncbi:hypothetical protein EBZ38_12255 [bacterium]|nr:hypothetical protein [bacterium]